MSEMRREDDGNQRPLGNSSNDIEPFSPRRDALLRAEPFSGSIGHYPSQWPFSGYLCLSDFFLLLCIFLEPLSNIMTSLIDQGRLLINSLIQWFRIHIHERPSHHKWRVNSRELKSNRFLGQGFSGIIYETTWSGREDLGLLARKDFPAVNGDVFENEVARLVGLGDHPYIVKSLCWTIDRRSCSLVMEYMRYDLYSVVQKRKGERRKVAACAGIFPPITSVKANTSPFDLFTSIHLISQIASGMMHLHDRGIGHGDLKPNNILVSSETSPMLVKLADFGLNQTKRMSTTLVSHRAHCLQIVKWKAPELFQDYLGSLNEDSENFWTGSTTESDIGKMANASKFGVSGNARMRSADIYSFALTCSYILGVQTWDPSLSWIELKNRISCGLRPQLPSGCPRSLASLISSCWAADPMLRPTFMSICGKLQVIISEQRLVESLIPGDDIVDSLPGVAPKKPTSSEDKQRVEESRTPILGDSSMNSLPLIIPKKPTCIEDKQSPVSESLGVRSLGRQGFEALDWETQKSHSFNEFNDFQQPTSFDSSARSSHFSPIISHARPIEGWKAHRDAVEIEPVSRAGRVDLPIGALAVPSVGSLPAGVPRNPRLKWSTWAKGEFLGSGAFSTVYEGVGSNGMFFAVKEISLSDQETTEKQAIRQLEQEIAFLSEIQHPHIVQYLGTERDGEKLYIFQELVSKGSLAHMYKKYVFFYDQVRAYTKQILFGLKYMHDRKIIHRDIKCSNILLDASGVVKLANYGIAINVDKLDLLKSFLGSAHWMAPEVVNPRMSYDLKADIWSLGCTVLEMAIGKPPFGEMEAHAVLSKVVHLEGPPIPDDLEEKMRSFIADCLEVNVASRPTCDSLLTHPFITGALMNSPVELVTCGGLPLTAEDLDLSAIGGIVGLLEMARSPYPACRAQAASGLQKFVEEEKDKTEIMQETAIINALTDLLKEENVNSQKDALLALYHISPSIGIQAEELLFQNILAFLHPKWQSNVRDAAIGLLNLMVKGNAENVRKFVETPQALKSILYCLDKDAENPSSQKCASALLNMATEDDANVRLGIAKSGLAILVKFVQKHGTLEHKEMLTTTLDMLCKSGNGCEEAVTKAGGHTFLLTSLEENVSKEAAAQGLLSLINDARTRDDVLQAGFVAIAVRSIDRKFASTKMALGFASICSTSYGLDQIVTSPHSVGALLILLECCPTLPGKGAAAAVIAKLYPRLNSIEGSKRQIEMIEACPRLIQYLDMEDKSQLNDFLKALVAFATSRMGRHRIHKERGESFLIRYLKTREIDTQARDLMLQILVEMSSVIQDVVTDNSRYYTLNVFLEYKIGELLCLLPSHEEFKQNTESMKNVLILIRNLSLVGPVACVHLAESGAVPMLLNVLSDHTSSWSPMTELAVKALEKIVDDPNGRKAFLSGEGIKSLVDVLKLDAPRTSDVKSITTAMLGSIAQDAKTGRAASEAIFSCNILQALNTIMYDGETSRIKWQAAVLIMLLAINGPTHRVCAAMYQAGTLDALNYLRSVLHCDEIANDILKFVRGKNSDCRRYIDRELQKIPK